MKKYIVNTLIFFAIVSAIDIAVGYAGDYLVSHINSGETKRTYDLVMIDKHDVLILGSSRARHHYDTPFLSDTLGLDVYNAGYDGNGVILAYGLLELILKRYQPKLIIYDVEPAFDINVYADDNNKRYIANLKPYYRHKTVGSVIEDVSKEEWYKVHSGMMRYNMSIITMLTESLRNSMEEDKGFNPLYGVHTRELQPLDGQKEFDSLKLEYVRKLISMATSQNIPIIVVASPKYGIKSSVDLQPVMNICQKYKVEFIDYYSNPEFMNHKEWFKEPMHLNASGARYFSEKIALNIESNLSVVREEK